MTTEKTRPVFVGRDCDAVYNRPFRDLAQCLCDYLCRSWGPVAAEVAADVVKETKPGTKSNSRVLDVIVPAYHGVNGLVEAGRLLVYMLERCTGAMRQPSKEDEKNNEKLLRDAKRCLKAIEKSRDQCSRQLEVFLVRSMSAREGRQLRKRG